MQRLNFLILAFLIAGLPCILWSQKVEFSPGDIEDPAVFEKGQVFPHSFHLPFETRESAIKSDPAANPNLLSLNGNWKFKWVHRPELAPGNFQLQRFNDRKWAEIVVPSNWQMEGYGHPKFRNIALTFTNSPPDAPDDYNPTGCYRRDFKIPRKWKNKEVILRFEGVKSAAYVWVNGHAVGYNQGGFEPAEFNVTPYLKKGNNSLAVKVIRFCDGSYLENQDMWRLSGIFRDVFLYARPRIHISDHYHYTDLDDQYRDAILHASVEISNASSKEVGGYTLEVDILNVAGQSILSEKVLREGISIGAGKKADVHLKAEVKDPLKWSAEIPNLYHISYSLSDPEGNIVEAFSEKLGFREVEINDEAILVNGIAIKFNGVNSHMHHPEHGQAVPEETLRKDLLIMKQHNINCVRTSHYPPSPVFLDLADELGMYIIDEVGDEAHQNIQLSHDSSYTKMYEDRSRELVYRDRNHPSVIIWSAGNESGSGPNIDRVIQAGKKVDPSRPGWMYGGNTFYIPFEDITGPRYWIPYQVQNLAKHKILGEEDLRPSFMDEYLAATGNGLGGLDEYWEMIRRYKKLTGGAIWDWVSPGITTTLWSTTDSSGYGNHGTVMGRPEFVNGRSGKALSLSGHDDWVEFYRAPSLDITGDKLAISFWVNPSEIEEPNTFLTKGSHQYGLFMETPGSLTFYIQQNNLNAIHQSPYFDNISKRIIVDCEVPDDWYGNWHHVAATYDGTEMSLYIDRERKAYIPVKGMIAHSPFPLCIGRDAEIQDQGEFSGRMSAMRIDNLQVMDTVPHIDELYHGMDPEITVLSMDFESSETGRTYYSTGLGGRTYGIVWPDRTTQPEIQQVKKSAQPVQITGIQPEIGIFMVRNYHHFTDLSAYEVLWTLLKDGVPAEEGLLKINCPAGDSTKLKIPFPRLKTSGELILTISLRLQEERKWAENGFEVAWEQFIIQESYADAPKSEKGKVTIREEEELWIISGKDFSYKISTTSGEFISMKIRDTIVLHSGPVFQIWRAPLANDLDPWGAYQYSEKKKMAGLGRSIDNQVRTLGFRDPVTEIENAHYDAKNGNVHLNINKIHNASNLRGAFESRESYLFYPDGAVEMEFHLSPHGILPDMLPKVGWQFHFPQEFREVSWYGRGPWENYPDRKSGSKIGVYHSDADREYVPYLIPQDHGNHTDVRWVRVENGLGPALRFSSDNLVNFSLHKYTTENLSRAMYPHQLIDAPFITLNIDFEVSGVGGTAIRQLEKYRVKPKEAVYHLRIDPIKY